MTEPPAPAPGRAPTPGRAASNPPRRAGGHPSRRAGGHPPRRAGEIETPEQRESRRILERVNAQTEALGTSALARSALDARDHFMGADADTDDPAEIWGRRIGRFGAAIALVVLAVWLVDYLLR